MQLIQQASKQPSGCCSAFYEQDWVRELARDSFHPGGADLTRKLAASLQLNPGDHVADLGCGTGTAASILTREFGFHVSGIDAGSDIIKRARARVQDATFIHADARQTTLPDAACDGVIAECAFSLFDDKPAVLKEVKRILKPGRRFGLTDVAVEAVLPQDLAEIAAPWTCLADAMPRADYEMLFENAGFRVEDFSDESQGIFDLIGSLKRSLVLLAAGTARGSIPLSVPIERIRYWMDRIRQETEAGVVRYYRFCLVRP